VVEESAEWAVEDAVCHLGVRVVVDEERAEYAADDVVQDPQTKMLVAEEGVT
jgi:hypothetical protein